MRQSLGKGLQSLIPKKQPKTETAVAVSVKQPARTALSRIKKESVFNIEVDKIRPNPHQPRKDIPKEELKELADSIREHGIIQPLIVSKVEKTDERGRQVEYELVAGERRWLAAKMAGLPHVPAIIRDSASQKKLEIALVENIQRQSLNPVETALAFKQLHDDFCLTHEEIARKIGKARATVSNALRILTLPQAVQDALVEGQITEGHARALLLAKPSARSAIFRAILKDNLTVRQVEDRARKAATPNKPRATGPKNPWFKKLERDLGETIGHPVSITQRGNVGNIKIEFSTQKELNDLVDRLSKI